jgi:hypothetical protein
MPKQTRHPPVAPTWITYREALGLFLRGATVPTASRIALRLTETEGSPPARGS